MSLLNIKINPEALKKLTNTQLESMNSLMNRGLKRANQNVLEDEFVGDFYSRYEIFQNIYEARKKVR